MIDTKTLQKLLGNNYQRKYRIILFAIFIICLHIVRIYFLYK